LRDADHNHIGPQGAAAIAHKRQGYADHRQEADVHSYINKHFQKNQDGQAIKGKKAIIADSAPDIMEETIKYDGKKENQEADAQKSQFFRDDRVNKIILRFRQEFQLRLGAETDSPAGQTARAHSDNRLRDVVALVHGLFLRIQEGQNPFFLIILEKKQPAGREDAQKHRHHQKKIDLFKTRHRNENKPKQKKQDSRTEIRLKHDQAGKKKDAEAGNKKMFYRLAAHRSGIKITGKKDQQGDFNEFHRLETDKIADINPAPRTADSLAE